MQTKLAIMQIDKQIYDEINEYCKLNNLKTRDFIHKLLKEAFIKEKYGETPFAFNKKAPETTTYQENSDEKHRDTALNNENIVQNTEEKVKIEELIPVVVESFNKVVENKPTPIIPIENFNGNMTPIIPDEQKYVKPKKKRTLK